MATRACFELEKKRQDKIFCRRPAPVLPSHCPSVVGDCRLRSCTSQEKTSLPHLTPKLGLCRYLKSGDHPSSAVQPSHTTNPDPLYPLLRFPTPDSTTLRVPPELRSQGDTKRVSGSKRQRQNAVRGTWGEQEGADPGPSLSSA